MSASHDAQRTVQRLLAGELSPEELGELLERLEHDPDLSGELDFGADLARALERQGTGLPTAPPLRAVPSVAAASQAPQGPRRRPWLALAAALVLLFGAVFLVSEFSSKGGDRRARGLAELAAPVYAPLVVRAPGDRAERDRIEFDRAMEAYAEGDFVAARDALEAFRRTHPEHLPARFYLAACRELTGDDAGAETLYAELGRIAGDSTGWLADHANWRLAHLLDRRGGQGPRLDRIHRDRARALLQALAESSGPFSELATELLRSTPER